MDANMRSALNCFLSPSQRIGVLPKREAAEVLHKGNRGVGKGWRSLLAEDVTVPPFPRWATESQAITQHAVTTTSPHPL